MEATIDGNETAGKGSAAGSGAVVHAGGAGSGGSHVVGKRRWFRHGPLRDEHHDGPQLLPR